MNSLETAIDLNADVGEGFGRWDASDSEGELIGQLTSANIACGAHAGDPTRLRRACATAAAAGVRVGAHVGYPDLLGFGRRAMAIDPDELTDSVVFQIGALLGCARAEGTCVRYVKPHGALYHACSSDEPTAAAVLAGIREIDLGLPILCPPGAAIERLATWHGVDAFLEGFADRRYGADGRLVPRGEPLAFLTGNAAVAQAVRLARRMAPDGTAGPISVQPVDSICVHGDQPGAARLASAIRAALEHAGVTLTPFTPARP